MVGTHNFLKDTGSFDMLFEALADEEIVDSPADIPIASAGFQIPPGILSRLVVKHPQGVDISPIDKFVYPGALFGKETGGLLILLWPGQVDRPVGGIDIAADNDIFAFLPGLFGMVKEGVVEVHLIFQPLF